MKKMNVLLLILSIILGIALFIIILFFIIGIFSTKAQDKADLRYKKQIENGNFVITKLEMMIDIRYKQEVVLSNHQRERIKQIKGLIALCDEKIRENNIIEGDALAEYLISIIPKLEYHNLEEILYCKPNLNYQNTEGKTPLMIACENKKHFIAEELIKRGALLEIEDNEGKTALIIACNIGHYETILKLLKSGANTKHIDKSGKKMIQQVSTTDDQIRIISKLIEYGAETK